MGKPRGPLEPELTSPSPFYQAIKEGFLEEVTPDGRSTGKTLQA